MRNDQKIIQKKTREYFEQKESLMIKKADIEKKIVFHDLLEKELSIYYNYENIRSKTLDELDITRSEVDLFLNRLESTYNIRIKEEDIKMNILFGDLVEKIRGSSVLQDQEEGLIQEL